MAELSLRPPPPRPTALWRLNVAGTAFSDTLSNRDLRALSCGWSGRDEWSFLGGCCECVAGRESEGQHWEGVESAQDAHQLADHKLPG